MSLSDQKRRFAHQYARHFNATRAAKSVGISPATAYKWSREWEVREIIEDVRSKNEAKIEVTIHELLSELKLLGFLDPIELFDKNGAMKPLHKIPEAARKALVGIKVTEIQDADGKVIGHLKDIKLADKMKALEMLAKHLGMLVERHKIEGDEKAPIVVRSEDVESRARRLLEQGAIDVLS